RVSIIIVRKAWKVPIIFNEFEKRRKLVLSIVNVRVLSPRRDCECWNTETLTVSVNLWWSDMIIEPTIIIPSNHNRSARPIRTLHHLIYQIGYVIHPAITSRRRMLTHTNSLASRRVIRRLKLVRYNPRYCRQFPILNI